MALALAEPLPLFVEVAPDFWRFRGESFEDHLEQWKDVDSKVQKDKWKLSAIAASLDTKYKDKTIERFAEKVNRSPRRIREYAQTYRAFENGERSPNASFHHHTVATASDDPSGAVHTAAEKGWSTRELEKWIETGLEPDAKPEKPEPLSRVMQALHSKVMREELSEKKSAVQSWLETPADPILSDVYNRLIKILDWQRTRTLESDCEAIMKIFTASEGTDGAERVTDTYIPAWLHWHGFIMTKEEIGHGGCPSRCLVVHEHVKPSERLGLMVRLKMLTVETREESRGPDQRGSISHVYAAERDYLARLDEINADLAPFRKVALHKEWIQKLERYAPELVPKTKPKAA